MVDDKQVDSINPPGKGRTVALEFLFSESGASVRIPFTEIALAAEWEKYLQQELQRLHNGA